MHAILFGATGMVGQGVLRECLLDPDVRSVLSIGRSATGQQHEKLRELVHQDLLDYSAIESRLWGFDACFFCLGVTSAGMSEENYRKVTYDITMAAAETLVKLNPGMTFIYVSGMGTDSTGRGRTMWARVKGQTENALLRLPFKAVFLFRPGFIVPQHGVRSKTGLYQAFYTVLGPLLPWLLRMAPKYGTSTEQVGRAMLQLAKHGASKAVFENADINGV
ncbi:MAG: NAD-dependent epimerase/dehydratase family protein [Bryobacteraceae bacterium]|jgi:uncharacterized protein YbjT (DUF2867 family)